MASLQTLKKRLKSIRSTGQLAGAMRTAATAKYAKLVRTREAFTPYAEACRALRSLLGGAGLSRKAETAEPRDCIVLLSGNRGMCGGFHAETFRLFEETLAGRKAPMLIAAGKKAAARLRERELPFEEFAVSDVPTYGESRALSGRIREIYQNDEAARVFFVRQSFRNMLIQTPVTERVLPGEEEDGGAADGGLYYFPDRESIAGELSVRCFDALVYELLLENAAGAQAATLLAMRSAYDNAQTAASELEIQINRRRQAEVTSGVIETASGNISTGD